MICRVIKTNKSFKCVVFIISFVMLNFAQGNQPPKIIKGITEPYNSSTVSATVTGKISVIRKKEGEYVKKGDIILELEKDEEELEADLCKLVADSKVEVTSAWYRDSILHLDYQSTKQLFDSTKSVSEEELLKKELDYRLAVADFERLQMQEKKEQIEYEIALAKVKKRIIVAPFNGVIVKVHCKIAESCNQQEPLVRVVDVSKCRFVAHIESALMNDLKMGSKVLLNFGGGTSAPSTKCEGVVEFVSPVIDPSSGLREIKVVFDNSDIQIRPGIIGTMSKMEMQ